LHCIRERRREEEDSYYHVVLQRTLLYFNLGAWWWIHWFKPQHYFELSGHVDASKEDASILFQLLIQFSYPSLLRNASGINRGISYGRILSALRLRSWIEEYRTKYITVLLVNNARSNIGVPETSYLAWVAEPVRAV
jgi:hypothetical protein